MLWGAGLVDGCMAVLLIKTLILGFSSRFDGKFMLLVWTEEAITNWHVIKILHSVSAFARIVRVVNWLVQVLISLLCQHVEAVTHQQFFLKPEFLFLFRLRVELYKFTRVVSRAYAQVGLLTNTGTLQCLVDIMDWSKTYLISVIVLVCLLTVVALLLWLAQLV